MLDSEPILEQIALKQLFNWNFSSDRRQQLL